MKMFLVVFVFLSSAAAAIFFSMQVVYVKPHKSISKEEFSSVNERMRQNLSHMRRIAKEGDIEDMAAFQFNSSRLIEEIKHSSSLRENFKQDYIKLYETINQTALSIKTKHPELSQKLITMKEQIQRFDKKTKSIGLAELRTNWHEMQKLYHQFMREPYAKTFQAYQLKHDETKKIITELYLDDTDEEQLFVFLDQHIEVLTVFYLVYTDVGIERICALKPIMYGLKEQLQLNASLFDEPTL